MEGMSFVSVLEQYLKSLNLYSTYQMVPKDNARQRSISFQLTVNDQTVTGVGKTKKEAKENAAEVMYNLLIAEEKERAQKDFNENNKEPVEALIQLCSQLSLGMPKFEYKSSDIFSHSTIYTVSCIVLGVREEVRSFRKDKAKKQVANAMFLKIKEQEKISDDFSRLKEEEMRKNDSLRLPNARHNFKAAKDLFDKVRHQQLAEYLKKSNTAYDLKMKPESEIYKLKNPEGVFQRIMKEIEVDYKIFFQFKNQEWFCCIEMFPINYIVKTKDKNKSRAGKCAIITSLRYMHEKYVL